MAMVPASSGIPTRANSKKPKPPTPASSAMFERSTFTGVPVRAVANCNEVVHRVERRQGTVEADERRQQREQDHRQDEQARAARAGSGVQLLAGPCRHAGGVESFAHDEERGDEDYGRVAEAGESLVEGEDS